MWNEEEVRRIQRTVPGGKWRVLQVDMFDGDNNIVGDYDTKEKAIEEANDRRKRACERQKGSGSLIDRFYVYDERGAFVHEGDENE